MAWSVPPFGPSLSNAATQLGPAPSATFGIAWGSELPTPAELPLSRRLTCSSGHDFHGNRQLLRVSRTERNKIVSQVHVVSAGRSDFCNVADACVIDVCVKGPQASNHVMSQAGRSEMQVSFVRVMHEFGIAGRHHLACCLQYVGRLVRQTYGWTTSAVPADHLVDVLTHYGLAVDFHAVLRECQRRSSVEAGLADRRFYRMQSGFWIVIHKSRAAIGSLSCVST
jgi:hypothetical protein